MTAPSNSRAALDAAVVALLDREVFVSRACLREYGPLDVPEGRPSWWPWMTPHTRDVAEAAEAVGLWTCPGDAA